MNKALNKTNWQTKNLGEVLLYEQPTKYIVKSTKYSDDYETPVLTAGKSFILGKTKEKEGVFPAKGLPVIIFDDFTTATKFVDFSFKVKSSAMKILHPVKNMSDAKFIFYIIQNINFDHTGIHKRYWISEYSKIEILLPPLLEQHRVVKILDDVFENITKAKENTKKNLQNSKDIFESYLQSVFTNPSNDFELRKIKDIAEIKGGKRVPRGYKLKNEKTQYPYIRVADFNDCGSVDIGNIRYIDKDIYEQIKRYIISTKDLYISIAGTIGKTGIIPQELENANLTENACKLVFKDNIYNKYIYYFTKDAEFIKQTELSTRKVAMPKMALSRLGNILVPIPRTFLEQKSIVVKLDALSDETKKLESIYKQKLADLEELKKSILKRAFNGDL